MLTLLPAFPVLLLVLRLWQLSRQDMSTMLLLVQYVSPLGLLSALLISLVWAVPLAVLVVGLLGSLLRVSAPDRFDPDRSLLASATARTPGWVFAVAVLLAALTWQLRFLPVLLMIALAVLGLRTRHRYADRPARLTVVCLALPVATAVLAYAALGPAIVTAGRAGEPVTVLLLAGPPALATLLTGPIPARVAPAMTTAAAFVTALVAPFVLGAIFLRVPILPEVAIEVAADPPGRSATTLLLGRVITVNDRMTIVLDPAGSVRFIPNERVSGQTLCPETARVPFSAVSVHGWQVEETALEWVMPSRSPVDPDPRCSGRLPEPEPAPTPNPMPTVVRR